MNTKKKNDILIIVPAYNEAWNIEQLIHSLTENDEKWDVLIVNDASMDNTGDLAESTQMAMVINLPYHLGIGGGVQTGFKFAKSMGYDYAVQFDGDGQHLVRELPTILEPVQNGEADVVIGSRFYKHKGGYRSSFLRRMGIKLFKMVTFMLIRQKIYDHTSGFRAYNKRAINCLAKEYPCDYPEPEAIVLLGKNGFKIKEVSAEMQERKGGISSLSRKGWFYMPKVLLGMLMTSTRPKLQLNE